MPLPSASVAHTSAPTVTKRISPVSVPNPIRLSPTYLNVSDKHPQGKKKIQCTLFSCLLIYNQRCQNRHEFCFFENLIHKTDFMLVCSEVICVINWENPSHGH